MHHTAPAPDGGLGWESQAGLLVWTPRHYPELCEEEMSSDAVDTRRKAKDKGKSAMSATPLTPDKAWLGLLALPWIHGLSISSEGAGRAGLLVESRG